MRYFDPPQPSLLRGELEMEVSLSRGELEMGVSLSRGELETGVSTTAYLSSELIATAKLPGNVQGVVVQIAKAKLGKNGVKISLAVSLTSVIGKAT